MGAVDNQHRGIVIAVDGPSGSGKSSTARGVARSRELRYLDTGAMYRAMTWWMIQHQVDIEDPHAVAEHVSRPVISMGDDPSAPGVAVDGTDVARAIRSAEVTGKVSAVSAVPAVRERLVGEQRAIIAESCEAGAGIVVEGRDIGTVVAPEATVKVFLTASEQARAKRRSKELTVADVAATQADLARRDQLDSTRAVSPLTQTGEAYEIDSTQLTLNEVVAVVVELADAAAERAVA